MKTSQMIQSKYLKKEDFPTPEVLTVKDCTLEEVGDDQKWVLWFKEKSKGLTLNVTKIRQLESVYGDDSDLWIGRKVKLALDPTVMMGTRLVGGIKMTLSSVTAASPKAPEPPPVEDHGFDDDIPFGFIVAPLIGLLAGAAAIAQHLVA